MKNNYLLTNFKTSLTLFFLCFMAFYALAETINTSNATKSKTRGLNTVATGSVPYYPFLKLDTVDIPYIKKFNGTIPQRYSCNKNRNNFFQFLRNPHSF